jgi:hypothetical protein
MGEIGGITMDAEQLRKELRRQGHVSMPPGLFGSCLSLTEVPVGLFSSCKHLGDEPIPLPAPATAPANPTQ